MSHIHDDPRRGSCILSPTGKQENGCLVCILRFDRNCRFVLVRHGTDGLACWSGPIAFRTDKGMAESSCMVSCGHDCLRFLPVRMGQAKLSSIAGLCADAPRRRGRVFACISWSSILSWAMVCCFCGCSVWFRLLSLYSSLLKGIGEDS